MDLTSKMNIYMQHVPLTSCKKSRHTNQIVVKKIVSGAREFFGLEKI